MPVDRRTLLSGAAASLPGLALAAPSLRAQSYPAQTIRIVVPTAPGGVADIAGRTLAQHLNAAGRTTVVENRTGAGGAIAADFVAKSAPDGYTLYVGFHATQAILPHLQKLNYDPLRDLQPVTIALRSANILVVHPALPVGNLAELLAHARANPGKLSFASQGNGSSGHIVGEQLRQLTGIDILHVPYRGAAPAMQDLIAGHVAMMFDILTLALPQVRAERVRPLAITTAERHPLFPGVPTTAEAGLAALEGGPWFGFFLPAATPRPIVDFLHGEARAAFSAAEHRDRFAQQALSLMLGTPEESAAFVAAEYRRWGEVIRRGNIKLE